MELDGEDVVAPDAGGECVAIPGLGRGDRGILRDRVKAVDEVDVAARGDAFIERAGGIENGYAIPADLRDFNRGMVVEPADVAFENTEPRFDTPEFLASFEQGLVADTDTQEGPA